VLDDIADHLTFKDKSLKRLIAEIIDAAEARWDGDFTDRRDHIKHRIDELAARYGNLGMTRKKLNNLVRKELRKRQGRACARECRERRERRNAI
jgi:hypothetical protein